MSEFILSQLQEAEAQLASQESDLASQLSAIQEQRKGLKTVIEMFQSPANSNGASVSGTAISEVLTSTADSPEQTAETVAVAEAPTAAPAKRGRKSSRKSVAKTVAEPKAKATRKPRGGKSPNWSRHIQEPFKKTALPDVVANILKSQPDDAFKIADVMEIIFKSDIPKATFLKARNRVSNILSAGARTGEWYRGRGGKYSMSEAALSK
ncbi:MAG: hypothetical protein AAF766_11650 [Cyanobacteria bacterium P01_D01_bin.14]